MLKLMMADGMDDGIAQGCSEAQAALEHPLDLPAKGRRMVGLQWRGQQLPTSNATPQRG